MTHFEYTPLTEEEIYRDSGLGDLWDRAESGDPMSSLLRERIRAAEGSFIAEFQPEFERMLFEGPMGSGLGDLLEGPKK